MAAYDASKTVPTVVDRGIGHILHTGHDCERLIVELLRDLFTWEDEHKLDESAVCERFKDLCAASEEADGLTRNEGKVLMLVAGSLFSLCGQREHWQSGHECLFEVARTMAADFRDRTNPRESLKNNLLRRTVADWPKLFAQLRRERLLAESGTDISLTPIALIGAIQQVQADDAPPGRLDGTFPEGSPAAKRSRAAKKAVETKAANKEKQAILLTDASNAAKVPPPPSVEARWAWQTMNEVEGRSQAETARILANRFGYKVTQQQVSVLLKQCENWVAKMGLQVEAVTCPLA